MGWGNGGVCGIHPFSRSKKSLCDAERLVCTTAAELSLMCSGVGACAVKQPVASDWFHQTSLYVHILPEYG